MTSPPRHPAFPPVRTAGDAFPRPPEGNACFVASLLHLYLQDHLAGATFGCQLVERCRRANERSEFGEPLAKLAGEIAADRETLIDVMRRVGADRSNVKVSAAWLAEKVRRLKPNGRLFSYTPLTRLLELEGLALGITGKRALWQALEQTGVEEAELGPVDFAALGKRAEEQLRSVESLRRAAAKLAFFSRERT
jgi:hypothetical protein